MKPYQLKSRERITVSDLLQKEWRDYRGKCTAHEAASPQMKEIQYAFYAGALATLNLVLTAPDVINEHGGINELIRWCHSFAKETP